MPKALRSILKVIAFLLILSLCLFTLNRLLFTGGDYYERNRLFYEQPENSVDVLLTGSSHVHSNISTGTLWDDFGIAAYDFSAGSQPIWVTYYRIKDALHHQKPAVIVLDAYKIVDTYDMYEKDGEQYSEMGAVTWNHYGIPFSIDKVESLKLSVPPDELLDYLFEYPLYHGSYSTILQLGLPEFGSSEIADSLKGSLINFNEYSDVYPNIDMTHYEEMTDLTPKSQEYLIKTIELCQEAGIPLVIVNAPYLRVSEEAQQGFNKVAAIAEEYDVPFLDYNKLLNELDLINGGEQTDFADTGHLNYRGAKKYTEHLGDYLKEHYAIPDRRNDADYESWQINADYIRTLIADHETSASSSALDNDEAL